MADVATDIIKDVSNFIDWKVRSRPYREELTDVSRWLATPVFLKNTGEKPFKGNKAWVANVDCSLQPKEEKAVTLNEVFLLLGYPLYYAAARQNCRKVLFSRYGQLTYFSKMDQDDFIRKVQVREMAGIDSDIQIPSIQGNTADLPQFEVYDMQHRLIDSPWPLYVEHYELPIPQPLEDRMEERISGVEEKNLQVLNKLLNAMDAAGVDVEDFIDKVADEKAKKEKG